MITFWSLITFFNFYNEKIINPFFIIFLFLKFLSYLKISFILLFFITYQILTRWVLSQFSHRKLFFLLHPGCSQKSTRIFFQLFTSLFFIDIHMCGEIWDFSYISHANFFIYKKLWKLWKFSFSLLTFFLLVDFFWFFINECSSRATDPNHRQHLTENRFAWMLLILV